MVAVGGWLDGCDGEIGMGRDVCVSRMLLLWRDAFIPALFRYLTLCECEKWHGFDGYAVRLRMGMGAQLRTVHQCARPFVSLSLRAYMPNVSDVSRSTVSIHW